MQELYNKLKKYTLKDVIKIEELDRQFIAIKILYENIENKENYLSLIIANSIICYQLSWKWEDYWEEFSKYFSNNQINKNNLLEELWNFIKQSKNNKRFIDTKIKRLEKLKLFLKKFYWKEKYFYKNMLELRDELSKTMKQKPDAKTIVFAVKMFNYWARNIYEFQKFPKEITIPVDSRITNLFEKYSPHTNLLPLKERGQWNIKDFYKELSERLDIPELHLDALVWVNYDELIK